MSTVQASMSGEPSPAVRTGGRLRVEPGELMAPFVERLTVRNWCAAIFPRLIWRRLCGHGLADRCRVIEGSRLAMAVARAGGWMIKVTVERLDFRLVEVRDEHGVWMWLRIVYEDLAAVQADAMEDPVFRNFVEPRLNGTRWRTHLAKSLAGFDPANGGTFSSALLMIRICHWIIRHRGPADAVPVLFVEQRPWQQAMARYASTFGVMVIHVPVRFPLRDWLRRHIAPELNHLLHAVTAMRRSRGQARGGRAPTGMTVAGRKESALAPRVSVEYYGHLNLKKPECHSDLFLWQQSALSGREIVMTFNLARAPLTESMWAELISRDIEAVALHPRAAAVRAAPLFAPPRTRARNVRDDVPGVQIRSRNLEEAWLRERTAAYRESRDYWTEFFSTYGIKIHLTWYKYREQHCVMADALQRLGGITAIYQRAYEDMPTPETTVDVDVLFGFSPAAAEVERRARSVIPYHVTVGYVGDHRFALLRERAGQVRQALQRRGAERILAFADEKSYSNPRLFLDHQSQQENYWFLLEKLLREPWLGLVFKPQSPATLRQRLGPVADLLRRAEATGRCYVFEEFEEGKIQGSYPPAAAALAADLAIHGHLFAGTAGLETALAGVPTLLLDREGWPLSALYRLGVRQVVFTDWDALWKACLEHWKRPGGIPGFGDWSRMLDELDPFRDGRAAERMGTYLRWLLEGFQAGLDRDTVMADAAERYAVLWGREQITHVNTTPAPRRFTPQPGSVVRDAMVLD